MMEKAIGIKKYRYLLTALLCVAFLTAPAAAGKLAQVRQITITDTPLTLKVKLDGRVPVKVIQLDDREVLIALRPARVKSGVRVKGKTLLKSFSMAHQDGNVLAMVVTSKTRLGKIRTGYSKDGKTLSVGLMQVSTPKPAVKPIPAKPLPKAPAPTVKAEPKPAPPERVVVTPTPPAAVPVPKPQAKPAKKPTPAKTITQMAPPKYQPPQRVKNEFKGDISDLYRVVSQVKCDSPEVREALTLIKRHSYSRAHTLLDEYVNRQNQACLEPVYYLSAYAYYKGLTPGDMVGLIQAERKFQDALVLYPRSKYLPFGYTAIGLIQEKMENLSAAEGYFNIVYQNHADYVGLPEVTYHLASIYDANGYTDKAMRYYRKVFESEQDNSYIPEAGVGYGKSLYQKQQFFDALRIFDYVITLDMKKIYDSPDLLLFRANANFELGLSRAARDQYMRVLNLFSDVKDRDLLLSKVGDTYGMEGQEDKAIKMYELVREKYPDTQGYVNSSIGLARYMENDEDKIEIYTMVKTRFPENTYSRIAMMRLAEIYQKNGEHDKCIKEIEDLLSTHPKGLRYEAVKLMQKAYEALFQKQLDKDDYTSVLTRYEQEYVRLDKMGSRRIESSVGAAYLQAGLWEEAFNHLMNAYKQYKRSQRSADLLFRLGVAMDESGRDKDALTMFAALVKQHKKSPRTVPALVRMGHIYAEMGQLDKASAPFIAAQEKATDPMEKGAILLAHARVAESRKDLVAAAELGEQAVKSFAQAPGKNYLVLTRAYKGLGNTYLAMKEFVRAADAFSKALDLSEGEEAKANLGFLLGDAYQKGNILNKARETFEYVAVNYDSIWARLARQRLSTLELAETAKNS